MKLRTTIAILVSVICWGCASTPDYETEENLLLWKIDEQLENYPTRSFVQHHAMRFMTHEDTMHSVYSVTLQRLPGDDFGYRFRGKSESGFGVMYDGKEAAYGRDSSFTRFDEHKQPGRHIEGTFASSARFPHIAGIKLFGALNNPMKDLEFEISEEEWEGEKAKCIEIREEQDAKETDDIERRILRITVRLRDTIPMRISEEMYIRDPMGTLLQYRDSWIENLDLDPEIPANYFSVASLPDYVQVKDYEEPSKEERLPLQAGNPAPDFTAAVCDGDSLRLSDLRGKVVFIDFWYVSCHPCQLAAPAIEKMYEEFGGSGDVVFLGVNPVDKADSKFLKKFLKSRDIQYPILLADRSVPKAYEVGGYPVFFIIDREGTIRWSGVGYAEGYEAEFRKQLQSVLDS